MERKLIELLNQALADEWLSYYCFWIGAKVMVGHMRDEIAKELEEMATEELKHAGILADKIIELGGTPVLTPKDWHKIANCSYEVPKDFSVKSILFQNIKSKQSAVDAYKELISFSKGKTSCNHESLANILEEEIEQKDYLINMVEHIAKKNSEKGLRI
ncbi:MAG: ferritin [Candidatus Omnitrophica bacterium]|nr:ferritin [Candidatus Omnitrophota bacterium]MBU1047070.1 ferritin [Candidatus Omnitrophota bacterium]MBU1630553.1 ferritin [Candidatus Omnitrophota bacterium]MBU1767417.1 ferritin [Candidatus Omnitrophota bacterium]MBU1888737.1 ferritin [Candidatus Omnitrophota bacterium]